MTEFGLLIDNEGVPGLHASVEAAKESFAQEVKTGWSRIYDTSDWAVAWSSPVDASYQTPAIYVDDSLNEPAPAHEVYGDFQLWGVMLNG